MTEQEIKNKPYTALKEFLDELTAEQFDYCIRQVPYLFRELSDNREVFGKMTPEQIEYCLRECPDTALLHCIDKLTPEQIDICIFEDPWTAKLFCANKLTDEQLDYCEELTKND